MKLRKHSTAAVAAALALAVAACSPPGEDDGGDGENGGGAQAGSAINAGWNQPFYSYNQNTSNGNATANANIKYLMNRGFNYYNEEQELVRDESYGTYEQTSEDPLTVEWTINDDVTWSDGTPVDAADMLLVWAAQSGNLNTLEAGDVERNPDTNVVEPGQGVYFDSSSEGLALVTQTPEISEDGQTLTLVYDEPFADWELDMGTDSINVPAHVTVMQALDIDDPQEAKDTLVQAVQEGNEDQLAQIADFWNSGYDYSSLPDDESLYLSNGAYLMTDFVENQYITLEANEDYAGDLAASFETITVRWNEDPMAQVQALENGEIDMMGPQATTDVVDALEGVDGVEVTTGTDATYEHIDLTFNNGGPFDPKSYGGDEQTARQVRQAFLHAVPRQEIVEKLIQPLNEDAEPRDSFMVSPGAPGYDEVVAENGSDEYGERDVEQAQQLLEQAGVDTPIDVRTMFATDNVRRENTFQILQQGLEEAGFNLQDASSPDWGSKLGDGTYDAVFFGWQSTSTGVTESSPTYRQGGINNLNGYNNDEVNNLLDRLKTTTDEEEQRTIMTEIDKLLFEDAYGITLFQFPGVTAWNTSVVDNVQPAPLSPTMFHGFWDWEIAS